MNNLLASHQIYNQGESYGCLPRAAYDRLLAGFSRITSDSLTTLESEAAKDGVDAVRLSVIYGTWRLDHVITGRGRVHSRMSSLLKNSSPARVLETYGITGLAKGCRYPALEVLRILAQRVLGQGPGNDFIAGRYFVPELATYLAEAMTYDHNEIEDRENNLSFEREAAFVNWVRDLTCDDSVRVKTEDDLRRSGECAGGTPDILFDRPVLLPGLAEKVRWIEYKNYFGTDLRLFLRGNARQCERYNEKWGPGAICYGYGFVCGLSVSGAAVCTMGRGKFFSEAGCGGAGSE